MTSKCPANDSVAHNSEELFDLDLFQVMDEQTAKEYFISLFLGLLDIDQLEVIWKNAPERISTTMRMDWAVSSAVESLDAMNAASIADADSQLVSQLKKADSRREAEKRRKARKKEADEKKKFEESAVGKSLTESQLQCYYSVRDVLQGCNYHFSSENVLSTIQKFNYDPNGAVNELLSFGVVEAPSTVVYNKATLEPTPSASKNVKKNCTTKKPAAAVPSSSSFSLRADASSSGDHTVIRGNNATSTTVSSSESEASPRSSTTPTTPAVISPLMRYYLMHLRTRNPGIIVSLDEDCMVYKGTQNDCCVVNAAGELTVSVDLHGQTRKPAVDLMQSSLLHYHAMLASRHMDHFTAPEGAQRRISKSQKANKAVSKLQFAEIKCVTITYVVGQGLHSEGAVPVLRNTLMQDLKAFWSDFDAMIDPENNGQIIVKVRRL